jgi:hypothetical protein
MPKRRARQPIAPRALLDAQITEAQLQRNCHELAHHLGYLCNHNYDSRRSGPDAGLPDDILAGHARLIFLEYKKQSGRITKKQDLWHRRLREAMVEVYVIRPLDWSSGVVEQILLGRAAP